MEAKKYHYWLCQTEKFGAVKIGALLRIFENAKAVYLASVLELTQAMEEINFDFHEEGRKAPFQEGDIDRLLGHRDHLGQCLERYHIMEKTGISFLTPYDPSYPKQFDDLYDKPQGLFLKGTLPEQYTGNVSIVGARRCSEYGGGLAYELGRRLIYRGVNVISGMAEGIDGAAHRGAIDGIYEAYEGGERPGIGRTLAFLGGGVDVCYPKCNMDIYKELAMESGEKDFSCGGLISEYGIGVMPFPGQFPMRNRLISAMSDMLIVCEARIRSGSLITADQALEQGKEVFVVPGRICDPLSEGCNRLIAQGAGIITNLDEFLDEHFSSMESEGNFFGKMKNKLAMNDEMVYIGLDFIPTHINTILKKTGLKLSVVLDSLYHLEQLGLIKESSKNYYVRKL